MKTSMVVTDFIAAVLVQGSAPQRCYVGQVSFIGTGYVRITLMDWFVQQCSGPDFVIPWTSLQSALVITRAEAVEDVDAVFSRLARFQSNMHKGDEK